MVSCGKAVEARYLLVRLGEVLFGSAGKVRNGGTPVGHGRVRNGALGIGMVWQGSRGQAWLGCYVLVWQGRKVRRGTVCFGEVGCALARQSRCV